MSDSRLFIGYETAFWIWRKAGPWAFSALTPSRVRSLAGGAPTRATIDRFRAEHPDLATDILHLVVRYEDFRTMDGVKTHVKRNQPLDRSFYKLDDDVYVASPELCLFQLATTLSNVQAIKLAMEMCGSYAIDPIYNDPGFCKRPPITNASKLKNYATRAYAPNSRAHSVAFTHWVANGSASPRETALYMLLCLPPRLGGYGIAKPQLNQRIKLSFEEQFLVGSHHFDCDAYWPDKRVAVEYDSAQYHTEAEKQERDAIRRNMLQYKNIQVITATRTQVNSPSKFDGLARQIAKATGKRLRTPKKDHIAARDELRQTLFAWDLFPAPTTYFDLNQ